MIHDLNTKKHKTLLIGEKLYFLGEINDELREDIGKINDSKLVSEWSKILVRQLKKYNEDFEVTIDQLKERDLLSFIKAAQG